MYNNLVNLVERLTVYFEDPFWIETFEIIERRKLPVCKVTFGTEPQEALKLQQEKNKQERKVKTKEQKEAEKQRLFDLKQRKKLEKHKGH